MPPLKNLMRRRMRVNPLDADADELNLNDDEKKVLLVSAKYEKKPLRWFKIDPWGESEKMNEIRSMGYGEGRPNLDIIRSTSVAVVGSSVYFIGGIRDYPLQDLPFKEVHVYNIKTATWSEAPRLNHPRINSIIVVVGRKIYVFGTCFFPRKSMHVPLQDWVECYDPDDSGSGWKTFSAPALDEETNARFFSLRLEVGVVYQDQIRFWGPCTAGIFAFSLSSHTWSFTREEEIQFLRCSSSPKPPLDFMSNHVVCGHLVLWHFHAKLYCWDLTKDTTVELCTLEDVSFSKPNPGPSQLLHLGNGLLYLLWWRNINITDKFELCCYKFQIDEKLLQSGIVQVQAVGVQLFNFPGSGIGLGIMLPASCCVGSGQ